MVQPIRLNENYHVSPQIELEDIKKLRIKALAKSSATDQTTKSLWSYILNIWRLQPRKLELNSKFCL